MPHNDVEDEARSPQEFFGDELKRKREAAGLTQAQLGERVVISAQMIAHFEAGRRNPRLDDAMRIDQALGSDGFFYRWRRSLSMSKFADHFAAASELEGQATVLRVYAATLVPGLLQTSAYAREIFASGTANHQLDKVTQLVANRIERARILEDLDGPEFWVMIDEAVIRRQVGSGPIMAEQLRHIASVARSGRIRLHVLPFEHGAHALLESMVVLMRFADAAPVAYVEGLKTGQVLDDPATVEYCQSAYDLALGQALPVSASLALVEQVAEEYGHDQ